MFGVCGTCDICDTLSLLSLQEQLELPEVPSEPLPEKIPGMLSLHSFGFSCSCPVQWSETLSQCPGKRAGAAAPGVGTGPAGQELQLLEWGQGQPGVGTGPAGQELQELPRLRSLFRVVTPLGSSLCDTCCSCPILYLP